MHFGRLEVVEYVGKYKYGGSLWRCRCICGGETVTRSQKLNSGHSKSCGCFIKDASKHRRTKSFDYRGSQLWNTYYNVKKRCENTNCQYYYCYGGRGIKCEWTSFGEFLKENLDKFNYAKKKFEGKRLSIERIDVNGNYNKKNVTWIPLRDQAKNMTTNVKLSFQGVTMNIADWAKTESCRKLRIKSGTIRDRLKLGWSIEKTLTTPVRKINNS